jgi:hypothetical protein
MVTVARLRRKPRHFQCFTGLTPTEFDRLLGQLAPVYQAAQEQRRQRPDRQRQPGAGHPFALALPERLLMGLMYLRLYVGQSLLSFLFDIEQSNVCRELSQRLLPVLQEVLPTPLRDAPLRAEPESCPQPSEPPTGRKRRINTLDELLGAYPELKEVLIDATEQPVPQPQDKHQRKLAYSGKQQDHTIKTQIVATKELILHVFGGLPGCFHDQLLLGASGVLHQVPPGVRVRLDKGYDGTGRRYPAVQVQQPVKKRRGYQVSALGRAFNPLLSVLRMPVEHHFARLQTFRILADVFRGRQEGHEDLFCIVAGLLNFRQTGRFCLE